MRLNLLVRERRQQLDRLDKCPNKDCPCRFVWREHVEENLTEKVAEISRRVRGKASKAAKSKAASARRSRR